MSENNEKKLSISQLKKYSYKLFNVEKYVCDGAFYGKTEKYTVEEAKQIIDEFLNKKL